MSKTLEVYFATGRAELQPEAGPLLDSLVYFFRKNPRAERFRITAHTDSVGGAEMNLALSKNRAKAVREALVQRGIAEEKIETSSFGERRPATANATEEGRQRNRRATLDIVYAIPMVAFAGQVKDGETGRGVEATVRFSTPTRSDSVRTDTAGRYAVRLPADSMVRVEAERKGYFFSSAMRRIYGSTDMLKKMKGNPADLALTPAVVGEKAEIDNLFFVGDMAVLLRSSEPELPKVLRFMQINPEVKIEIAGHVNDPKSERQTFGKILSHDRAKMVYDYLVEHGIPVERMTFNGYGNTEMLFPKPKNEDQMERNRRVEIRIRK